MVELFHRATGFLLREPNEAELIVRLCGTGIQMDRFFQFLCGPIEQ